MDMKLLGTPLAALLAVITASTAASAQTRPPGAPPAGGAPGAAAQQGGAISGTVVDAEGQPVASAQVAVRSAADSSLVAGVVARPNGAFRVEGLRPGRYFLRVSSLGNATTTTAAVEITPQSPVANVGTVRMSRGALLLEGVTVEATAQSTGLAPDRNTYRAADLPTAGGSAVDVLRNIPAVEVDQDGNVSLRGNQNVAVQINGRPTPMRGDQLATFLQQLPAGVVQNVEVVPNPSAKYEPEGMAGIINIVLKANTDLGLSYGVQTGVGTGGRYNASGNVGYQQGPLTLFGSYGFRRDVRQNEGFNTLNSFTDSVSRIVDYTVRQDNLGEFNTLSHLVNGNADLRLGERDVLSASGLFSLGGFDAGSDNDYIRRSPSGTLLLETEGLTDNESDDITVDGSLAFRHTITPQRHELNAELRANHVENNFASIIDERLVTSADGAPVGLVRSGQDAEALATVYTAQLDYTRPLGEVAKLETGYKGTLRLLDNDQAVRAFNDDTDTWTPNGRSVFSYDETVNAGYGVLSRSFGPVDVQGGLRAEYTSREFTLGNTGESFPKDYLSWFPSGLAAWNVDDQQQVRLSYSRRIQRPDTRLLNPFTVNEDPRNIFQGNPDLEAEFTNAFELGYQRSFPTGSMQVTPFFRRTDNAIRRIREVRGDTLRVTFQNLDTSDSYGMDVNGSVRMGKLNALGSVSAFRQVTNASGAGSDNLNSDALGWSARISGSYQVTPRTDVQAFAFYRAPMDVEQGRMGRMVFMNLAARQKVMGDRGSIGLRLQDPFNLSGFSLETRSPLYDQYTERSFGGRALFLTFTYNYGQQPRLRQRPQEQQEPQSPSVLGP
ncbi:TonB-dependent receptor [Longimicrobium terrae]|uniref:Outer membrane receptor protein involved in Fe transport n=1 Tax=Longimicrobium terrae TaxID=1639882 RepID=A0A841H662_9BACT|nr:TonB-dependent receptor [Longimicrobium terrae]MBB4639184.1 outer membrane receptor protein involved in Fe transport [Longimicrobium terrae]MBB6073412.1 outer membrane receptor protein involved in Fe transport [Longimicrobium terrae]NNC32600.1 TonB-dependent receptor [Longimicrobium terrae]